MNITIKQYKFREIFVAILIALLSAILILPSSAFATTPYDSNLQLTSSVKLYRDDSGITNDCSEVDVTSNWADPLSNYTGGNTNYQIARDSFNTARESGGRWGVSYQDTWYPYDQKYYFIFWTEDDSLALQFDNPGFFDTVLAFAAESDGVTTKAGLKYVQIRGADGSFGAPCTPEIIDAAITGSVGIGISHDSGMRKSFFVYTDHPNYPANYAGANVVTWNTHGDTDGLSKVLEDAQGTSDNDDDSDNDGINDLKESTSYSDRNAVYCDTETTPHTCAFPDPVKKDIYVEIDWMNDGTRDYKPSTTQLGLVASAFANKNINIHFDTGQYGGGNQLPSLSQPLIFAPTLGGLDLYDLKNGADEIDAQFSPLRYQIWRYMITGQDYYKDVINPGTSGSAYPGDDDSMISIEFLENGNHSNLNTAVAGTIMHELGHNLCLTPEAAYTNQASQCVYDEMEKYGAPATYNSVMNYDKQFSMVMINYSDGGNLPSDDHDDWGAVNLGMDDFQVSLYEHTGTGERARRGQSDIHQRMIDDIQ